MKKVTAFIGTQSRRNTYYAVRQFEKSLKRQGEINFEYVFLSDYHLDLCLGCRLCFDKGEEFCPLKDDRDLLLEKMERSDGIILASPNYAFHITARMKNLLDRTAFTNHRPRFFGKVCTAVVTQGMMGGGSLVKYLCSAGENMGFRASKGCCVNTLEPMTARAREALSRKIEKTSARFYRELVRSTPAPSFLRLAIFRMSRTRIKALDDSYKDYRYYSERGWFESGYYHPTSLGPVKKLVGGLADFAGRQMAKRS